MQENKFSWKSISSENKAEKIAIIGSGSFGTAIAKIIGDNGHNISWWVRDKKKADYINKTRHNAKYLTHVRLSESLVASSNLESVVKDADLIFLVLPSQVTPMIVEQMAPFLKNASSIVSTVKGFYSGEEFLMTSYIKKLLEGKNIKISMLSGPNIAREIVDGNYTGSVIASGDDQLKRNVQEIMQTPYMKIYPSDDMAGVELAGTLKNIYAIAAGIVDALHEGANCKSLLMSLSFQEMIKFSSHFGAKIETLASLAGIGDLFTTCISELSRNHRLGMAIAGGLSLNEARAVLGGISEGYDTLLLTQNKSKQLNIDLPIVSSVSEVIEGKLSASEFVSSWM